MAKNKKSTKRINAKKLLRELQQEVEKTDTGDLKIEILAPTTVSRARRKRQSLMDNPRNRFAYSLEERILHDRECPYVSRIRDEEFYMSGNLIYGMPICPHCEKQALVRTAIGKDQKRIKAYVGLLKRMKATKADLRMLILQHRAKLLAVSKDSITVKVKDDEWLFVKGETENELFHNNYKVLPDLSREPFPGYHQHTYQKNPSFGFLVEQVCKYSWMEHIVKFRERAFKEAIRATSVKMRSVLMWQLQDQTKTVAVQFSILDLNGYAVRCMRNEGVRFKVTHKYSKCDEKSDLSCELITVQIFREDIKAFHRAMRKFRSCIINNAYDRFSDLCKRYIDQEYVAYKEPAKTLWPQIVLFVYRHLSRQ